MGCWGLKTCLICHHVNTPPKRQTQQKTHPTGCESDFGFFAKTCEWILPSLHVCWVLELYSMWNKNYRCLKSLTVNTFCDNGFLGQEAFTVGDFQLLLLFYSCRAFKLGEYEEAVDSFALIIICWNPFNTISVSYPFRCLSVVIVFFLVYWLCG